MLGVLLPYNNSETEAFSEEFNLELLDDSFLAVDNYQTDNIKPTVNIRVDILSDTISEIVNDTSTINITSLKKDKIVKKGRKRGRKPGYRSENSNRDDTVCGVCGDKVSTY